MTISEMIKALTEHAGLSQGEIAALVGVSQPTIHRASKGGSILYETGKAIERLYSELIEAKGGSVERAAA